MDIAAIEKRGRDLYRLIHNLEAIGCCEETVSEAIRIGGEFVPVFGQQLKGVYIRDDGRREPHFALPGWYEIEAVLGVTGSIIRILSQRSSDRFECCSSCLLAVLGANLEYVEKGLSP